MGRGFSLVGLLVTMVLIVVLFSVLMGSLNTAIRGAGNTLPGTATSTADQVTLQQLFQSLLAGSVGGQGGFPVPSRMARLDDWDANTSAALWSTLIMENATSPSALVSRNERSPYVWEDEDYDYRAHDPVVGRTWDPGFQADLAEESNVSFAHMPLFGERFESQWERAALDGRFPLIGSRGPENGIPTGASYTNGRDGTWAGHVVYADGHVIWTDSFSPDGLSYERSGIRHPDNLFAMEDGPDGRDAILAFTQLMTGAGPVLQYD